MGNEQVSTNFVSLPFSSQPPSKYTRPPHIVADASGNRWGRQPTVHHWRVSLSITSTVVRLSVLNMDIVPPTTTKDVSLHTAVVRKRLVGIGGYIFNHFLSLPSPTRLRSMLVGSPNNSPQTTVRKLLTTTRLKS